MEKTIYCLVIISMYGFENPLSLTFTFQLSLSLLLSPSTLTFTSTNIKLIKVIWVLDFTSAFGSYWSRQISTLESVQLCVFIVVHIYSVHCTLCRLPTGALFLYISSHIHLFIQLARSSFPKYSWLGAHQLYSFLWETVNTHQHRLSNWCRIQRSKETSVTACASVSVQICWHFQNPCSQTFLNIFIWIPIKITTIVLMIPGLLMI